MSVLIEVAELAERLAAPDPPVLADVRWTLGGPPGEEEFRAGHLPGAQWVDLEHELSGHEPGHGRHPLPDPEVFAAAMRRLGLTAGTLLVAYDAGSSLAASRLWWMLTDAGHDRVRVLNGGLAAWGAAGQPLETGVGKPRSPGDFVMRPGGWREVTAPEILAGDPSRPLLDVRAEPRYAGTEEPYDPVGGHIPGAVNLPSMTNLSEDGRFLAPEALRERFAAVAAEPVVYCGSGITAAHTLLAMRVAGRPDGRLYAGSWSDWVSDPGRPVATGPDPDGPAPSKH